MRTTFRLKLSRPSVMMAPKIHMLMSQIPASQPVSGRAQPVAGAGTAAA